MTKSKEPEGEFNIHESLVPLAVPIGELTPDPRNTRNHGDKSIKAIADSYLHHGQRKPIVVQKNGMIVRAGNGQLEAAAMLGWTHIAAVIVDETDELAVGFAIADNRSAEHADWRMDVLASSLEEYPDIAGTGFGDDEIEAIIGVDWAAGALGDVESTVSEHKRKTGGETEIDVDDIKLSHQCPRCSFEF